MDSGLWSKAQALFLRCADLPEGERDELLELACEGDPALRPVVEDLLRGDAAQADYREAVARAAQRRIAEDTAHRRGMRIGPYTLVSRIAEGGMGVVYLAERSDRRFEQRVAIKLLPTALATRDLKQRLLIERQILADLHHPHIASLLDGGETEDGVPWLAMEYIDGLAVDEYCDDHRLGVAQRLAIFVQVCRAVHYAHSNLVIHRDLKPSNILVTKDGVPKLLDFGIAKLLDGRYTPRTMAMTVAGARLLTPRHASPEQLAGGPITTASDVYSLGLLLYDLLCGSFPHDIPEGASASEFEKRVIEDEPHPPSRQLAAAADADEVARRRGTNASDLRVQLRGDLDTIVLKALRKEPGARYSSPLELAVDLEHAVTHRPILARPPTWTYLLSRFWLRHRTAAVGVVATLIALIGGATAATVGFFRATEAERLAVLEARHADATAQFLVSLFQEADPDTSAGDARSVHEILAIGLERADAELAHSPVTLAKVLETLSGVYKGLAEYSRAESLQRRALGLHRAAVPEDRAGEARLLNDLGDLLRIQSRHEEAATLIRESLAIHSALGNISDDRADALNNLGLVYEETGRQAEATLQLLEALEMRRRLFEPPHEKISNSLQNLAWHYARGVDLDKAEHYALRNLEMRVAVHGEVHPRVAAAQMQLSRIYKQQGRWDEAESAARRSVAIAEQIFESGHPDLSFPLYELADVLHTRGRLTKARELFGQIVAWERVSLGPDSHDLGMSIKAYASVLFELADYAQAETLLREALQIFTRLPGGSTRARQNAETMLGRVLIATGALQEAAVLLGADKDVPARGSGTDAIGESRRLALVDYFLATRQADKARELLDGLDLDSPDLLLAEARILRAEHRPEAAAEVLQALVLDVSDRWGAFHWQVARARAELGRARLDSGALESGRSELEAAQAALAAELGNAHPEVSRIQADLLELAKASSGKP